MAQKVIRIGTRDSELALWQARTVEKKLNDLGYKTEIVAVKSTGDIILNKPLYELGITGIFTKTLDIAMINGQVDIAVHSMKDVPTALPEGIVQAAVLERANEKDLLLYKTNLDFLSQEATIASGSLRRQAQWLHKYPNHKVVDLRGNVNLRMQKLNDSDWNGAIFAAAGLERIGLTPTLSKGEGAKIGLDHINLDWMIPAPAQGAMVVLAMANNEFCWQAVSELNDI
ncbi:MAG: hydroxymethylbilane synthase, partial [Flavobacterium sp.]|nr:hydroxymethylbilane synthase [Flavobacterium sp.]